MCNFPESSFIDPTITSITTNTGQVINTATAGRIIQPQFGGSGQPHPPLQSGDSIEQLTVEEVQAILTSVLTGSTVSSSQTQSEITVKKEPIEEEATTSSRMLLVQSTQVINPLFFFSFLFLRDVFIEMRVKAGRLLVCTLTENRLFTCQNWVRSVRGRGRYEFKLRSPTLDNCLSCKCAPRWDTFPSYDETRGRIRKLYLTF